MTKTKSTKRALLSSLLVLLVCVSMLIGSTYAWFTDSVTSGNNKIVAGNLDVQLLMDPDGKGYDDISDSTAPIFGAGSIAQNVNGETLWEPGKTQVAYLAIKNNGSLALKYKVALDVTDVSKNLYEVMEYDIVEDAKYGDVKSWTDGASVVVGRQAVSNDVSLAVGDTHYFALAIHMNEEAGNEYQGGEVNFDMTILATQDTVEEDSFDNQYDNMAFVSDAEQLKAAIEAGGNVTLADDIAVTDWNAAIAKNVETNLYLNGKTLSATSTKSTANYTVFSVAKGGTLNIFGNGTIEVAHVGADMEWNSMTAIAHAYGEINVSNGANIINYGGTAMAFGLTGYIGCDITIEDSTVASTYCAVRVQNGTTTPTESNVEVANSSLISYTHNRAFWHQVDAKNSGPVNMKGIESEAAANEAGNTIYGAVREGANNIWIGGTAGKYPTMVTTADALTTALENGGEVVLAADMDAGETTFALPAGKTAAIDLNGHTISGIDKTEKNYGLINVGVGATLTINDSKDSGAIITSATVDSGWARYSSVISNQRGTVIINGGTIENKGGTSMSYAIDNLTNGQATYAKTVINSGNIKSSYIGIRQFCNGIESENILEVNGGTITGVKRSVWMQNANTKANSGTLTINDGSFNGAVLVDSDAFVVTIADSYNIVESESGLILSAK